MGWNWLDVNKWKDPKTRVQGWSNTVISLRISFLGGGGITALSQQCNGMVPNHAPTNPITHNLRNANTTSVLYYQHLIQMLRMFSGTLYARTSVTPRSFFQSCTNALSKSRGNPQNVAMENQQELWEQTPQWPMYCWTISALLVHDQKTSLSRMAEWINTIP